MVSKAVVGIAVMGGVLIIWSLVFFATFFSSGGRYSPSSRAKYKSVRVVPRRLARVDMILRLFRPV